jgi:methyl-accepting chemotaxis protein
MTGAPIDDTPGQTALAGTADHETEGSVENPVPRDVNHRGGLDFGDMGRPVDSSAGQNRESLRAKRRTAEEVAFNRAGASHGALYFGWLYVVAWAVGTFPLFLDVGNTQLTIIPWAVMLLYGALGYKKAEQTGTMFEFADSIYYLGFTLSVGALLASLDPFHPGVRPDAEKLFPRFGLAMITTLFGVVGRTALQTFYRLPSETIEAINVRLTLEAGRYVERLTELTSAMDAILTTHVRSLEANVIPQFGVLTTALSTTVTHLERAADGTKTLGKSVGEATDSLTKMTAQYRGRVDDVVSSHDLVAKSAKELATALSGSADSANDSMTALVASVESLGSRTQLTVDALDRVAQGLSSVTIDPTPLKTPIETIGKALGDAATGARSEVRVLRVATAALLEEVNRVKATHDEITRRAFSTSLDLLSKELDELAASTSAQRKLTDTEVAMLQAHVTTALTASRDVSTALEEIASVTLKRLQRLTAVGNN